jgi:hypothetical protein
MRRYTYALSALRYKRATLAGEIEHAERAIAKQREQLAALDATLRLFHPDADPSHITSIRPVWRGVWFRHGERHRLCLEALRDAGAPLTTMEIARYLMRAKHLDADDGKLRTMMWEGAWMTLTRLVAKGQVRRIVVKPDSWWELV